MLRKWLSAIIIADKLNVVKAVFKSFSVGLKQRFLLPKDNKTSSRIFATSGGAHTFEYTVIKHSVPSNRQWSKHYESTKVKIISRSGGATAQQYPLVGLANDERKYRIAIAAAPVQLDVMSVKPERKHEFDIIIKRMAERSSAIISAV